MEEKTYVVPQDLWDAFITAATEARKFQFSVKGAMEAIADKMGLIMPTIQVVDADTRTITGEIRPTPEVAAAKEVLLVADKLRTMDKDAAAKAVQLAKAEAVRSVGEQLDKLLYGGWTLEAAMFEKETDEAAGVVPALTVVKETLDA